MGALVHAAPRIQTMVTVPPQRYFVERIGGERVAVAVMVPPGFDPHTYEPRPAQLIALQRAQVYFALGDAFEGAWLGRLVADGQGARIVRTDAGIRKLDSGRAGGGGDDRGGDPHIWLSPPLVKVQARHIRDGLIAADEPGRAAYAANYERFAAELERMDGDFKALFRDAPQREFVVFHPAWTYFAQAYGLTQTAVEVEGKSPTPLQMQRLVERMRQRRIRVVFAQPQRSLRLAETVAASVGARVVVADDLAENWEDNLRSVARQLRSALEEGGP
jgi:zinc transport system substrate-binding protein